VKATLGGLAEAVSFAKLHTESITATSGTPMLRGQSKHLPPSTSFEPSIAMSHTAFFRRRRVLRAGKALALAGGFGALAAPALQAGAAEPTTPVLKVLAVRPEKAELRVGESVRVSFDLETPPRWHLYPAAKKPLLGKQTLFEFDGAEVAGPIVEPRPRYQREGTLESDFHEGRVTITVPVLLAPGAGPGPRVLKGRVVYQLCDWNLCLNGQVPFQFSLSLIDGAPAADAAKR
jgi:DsbC/DsbD-like thiol-disulfide interchange protein